MGGRGWGGSGGGGWGGLGRSLLRTAERSAGLRFRAAARVCRESACLEAAARPSRLRAFSALANAFVTVWRSACSHLSPYPASLSAEFPRVLCLSWEQAISRQRASPSNVLWRLPACRPSAALTFANRLHLLANKFPSSRRSRFPFALVTPRTFDCLFLGHGIFKSIRSRLVSARMKGNYTRGTHM